MTGEFNPDAVDPSDHVVELYRSASLDGKHAPEKVVNVARVLLDQLKQIEVYERAEHYAATSEVLRDLADDAEHSVDTLIGTFESKAREIASHIGYKGVSGDELREFCLVGLRELKEEEAAERAEELAQKINLELPLENVGLDEYIENYLVKIKRAVPEDHVNDDELVFVFDEPDGTVLIEMDAETPTNRRDFFNAIRSATSLQVRNKMASSKLQEEIDGDVTKDGSIEKKQYRIASLGPKARPWGDAPGLFEESITHTLSEYEERHQVPGARTEAWERLQEKLANCPVTTNLDDAIAHTKPYWDEFYEDILVPTKMVDDACEGINVERTTLYKEIDARGLSNRFSGNKISEPRTDSDGNAMRFWFFDAIHPNVPRPVDEQLVDSIGGGLDNLPDGPVRDLDMSNVSADGGTGVDDDAEDSDDDDTAGGNLE